VFRKNLLELEEWVKHVYNCDYAIQLMLATKCPFYYIDKIMSVYRVHAGGSGQGRKYFYHPIKVIETLSIFNCVSGFKYDQLIKQRLDNLRAEMLDGLPYRALRSTILGRRFWKKLWHSGSIIM
jgi:hypothetical protein